MRIRALLVACLVTALSLIALPANAASAIQFRKIQYDPSGSDVRANYQLNREYVTITNTGTTTRTLTGWTVRDLANHVYTFPSFKLGPGKSVRLHTGKGTNSSTDLYWAKGGTSGTTPATKRPRATAAERSRTPAPGEPATGSGTAKRSRSTAPQAWRIGHHLKRGRHCVAGITANIRWRSAIGGAVRLGRGRVSARSLVVRPWPRVAGRWPAGPLPAPSRPQLPRPARTPGLR